MEKQTIGPTACVQLPPSVFRPLLTPFFVSSLEEATVEAPLPKNPPGSVNNAHTRFYETFKRVTWQYDPDFVAKRHQELNSMLILVSAFFHVLDGGADLFFRGE
jgi:hypothetical protein